MEKNRFSVCGRVRKKNSGRKKSKLLLKEKKKCCHCCDHVAPSLVRQWAAPDHVVPSMCPYLDSGSFVILHTCLPPPLSFFSVKSIHLFSFYSKTGERFTNSWFPRWRFSFFFSSFSLLKVFYFFLFSYLSSLLFSLPLLRRFLISSLFRRSAFC